MKTKFIKTHNPKDGKVVVDLPPDPYLGLLLRVQGETDTGQTLTLANLGDVRLDRDGQKHAESFEFYHNHTDLKSGFPKTVTGSANQTEEVVAVMPFFHKIPNVMDIFSRDEADITIDVDGTSFGTLFGSNEVKYEIYGIVEPSLFEQYVLDVRTQNINKGASGRFQEVLTRSNIASLFVEDANDKVDELQVDVDGEIIWDNIDQDLLTIVTNLTNQIEASGNALGEINMIETNDIREAVNGKTKVNVTFNASGTLDVTIFSFEGSKNAERSRARRDAFLDRKTQMLQEKSL